MPTETATFAAECFWGTEAKFRGTCGRHAGTVGYRGGDVGHPSYEQVCRGSIGHAEAVEVECERDAISYEDLLATFWSIHNPTTRNRQGWDFGSQCRSASFMHSEHQQAAALASCSARQAQTRRKIVAEIVPARRFWAADEHHQRYLEKPGTRELCRQPQCSVTQPPRHRALGAYVIFAALALALALAAAGCGGGGRATAREQAEIARPPAATHRKAPARHARPAPTLVRFHASRYGKILVDTRGRTLYLFTADSPSVTRCAGACAEAWPPYTIVSGRRAQAGASAHAVGRLRRSDGSSQVTYHGHPLYYYVGDRSPGQILCQDVEEYGGHWWVVSPSGMAVTGASS